MKQFRCMIIDDEPLARRRVESLLKEQDDITIVGEAGNGHDAIALILEKKPDLIFLDIQMPLCDGFGVLARLKPEERPEVIFATAYDQYAIKAFEVHAVDYLLKPFDNERFEAALDKARGLLRMKRPQDFVDNLLDMVRLYREDQNRYLQHFIYKKKGRMVKVAARDVLYLEASGNYLALVTANEEHLYRGTMNGIEAELDPTVFLRIHRSYMVNTAHVKDVTYLNNNEYCFQFENGDSRDSGRRYKDAIMAFLTASDMEAKGDTD